MTDIPLPRITTAIMRGNEHFCVRGEDQFYNMLDFWQWACSDLLDPGMRAMLAEYIVARALGVKIKGAARDPWGLWDFTMPEGVKVEVQSAAYLRRWEQKKLPDISFGIAQTLAWNDKAGWYSEELPRQSDVYVFALMKHTDKSTVDPLNLDQWEFYVLPTHILDKHHPDAKTISLAGVRKLAGDPVPWPGLRAKVLEET